MKIKFISIIICLFACKKTEVTPTPNLDQGVIDMRSSMIGHWIVQYIRIWSAPPDPQGLGYSEWNPLTIDCNASYSYKFNIVKDLSISALSDSLSVLNTFYCSPSQVTYYKVKRDSKNKIIIQEGNGKTALWEYNVIISNNTMTLTAYPAYSVVLMQPFNPWEYQLNLQKQ